VAERASAAGRVVAVYVNRRWRHRDADIELAGTPPPLPPPPTKSIVYAR